MTLIHLLSDLTLCVIYNGNRDNEKNSNSLAANWLHSEAKFMHAGFVICVCYLTGTFSFICTCAVVELIIFDLILTVIEFSDCIHSFISVKLLLENIF